jgi:hypothetical protein
MRASHSGGQQLFLDILEPTAESTKQVRATNCLMPLSNPFAVQTFLDNFFEHGQGDKESSSHPYSPYSAGVNPPVERGARDATPSAPAEKAPSVGGGEHGQGSRRLFGILPSEGWNGSSNGVGRHGETIPPTKFTVDRRQSNQLLDTTLGCVPQHKLHAFLGQPMPIPDAPIVGLVVRQAEFGLV